MRDRYPPVISPGIYLLACQFSKYSKEPVFVYNCSSKNMRKVTCQRTAGSLKFLK
jgi:hypothetical protein